MCLWIVEIGPKTGPSSALILNCNFAIEFAIAIAVSFYIFSENREHISFSALIPIFNCPKESFGLKDFENPEDDIRSVSSRKRVFL